MTQVIADRKAFRRWLDQASRDELSLRHTALVGLLAELTQTDTIAQARGFLRDVEEEMIARQMLVDE